jgi:hypothetical protein
MCKDAELRCRCGEVQGRVANASPDTVNRVICYCDDCQAYLHYLDRADLLDAPGGTDAVLVAPRALSFDRGNERIVGLRLTPKGLYRWYASCCKTPIGNTLGLTIPFVGIIAKAFDDGAQRVDELFGKPIGAHQVKYAVGDTPAGSRRFHWRIILRMLGPSFGWRLSGKTWSHPFYDRVTRTLSHPLATLSPTEREALRPLCGPHPAVHSDLVVSG